MFLLEKDVAILIDFKFQETVYYIYAKSISHSFSHTESYYHTCRPLGAKIFYSVCLLNPQRRRRQRPGDHFA